MDTTRTKRLIGAQATALPKKVFFSYVIKNPILKEIILHFLTVLKVQKTAPLFKRVWLLGTRQVALKGEEGERFKNGRCDGKGLI